MVPTVTIAPRRPAVYLDENLFNHHNARHADSLHDPTDDTMTKHKHKGRRYCFIAGILDGGSDVSGLDIFVCGKKNGKTVKDYHLMFNHDYFVDCFDKLLDKVEELGWASAVFVMDNAQYHKGKPKSTSKGTWKNSALYEAFVQYQLQDVSPTDLKSTIWKTLKRHLDEHVPPVVVSMPRSRGHHVVYAAPGFSKLQPTEMVWANVKDVYDRLERAFHELDSGVICNTIKTSTENLLALHQALRAAEEVEPICYDQANNSDTPLNEDSSSSSESSSCESEG
ncbi:hypothetical protein H310_11756 [Aphanomyces invadans]|uniref:Tc1-like transposase DDE domain-containing protein n=1 Tax=Aphanomyces invadans TaxID=157072 RepID=A0A024TLF2_9STRA|nr:hypothetical protein H310_11756 [Aphanomyces invadans]ETV94431.1 hypothetical protein H310_11756 [Aphanomyces invadans]|eukprot:XP_008876746.1 hypothetical protein H310_11756 [Aphanomyces invadans]